MSWRQSDENLVDDSTQREKELSIERYLEVEGVEDVEECLEESWSFLQS